MYLGKHDCKITTRCPHCRKVTIAEVDYEQEKNALGKVVAEIIPEVVCGVCAGTAFKRSRFELVFAEVTREISRG